MNELPPTSTQQQPEEQDCKPAAVVVTPERPLRHQEEQDDHETTTTAATSFVAAAASAKPNDAETTKQGGRRGPLTAEEWRELWKDKEFRMSHLEMWEFQDVIRLVWPELYYYNPSYVNHDDEWEVEWQRRDRLPVRPQIERMVRQFLEFTEEFFIETVKEVGDLGTPPYEDEDDHFYIDYPAELRKAVTWDTPERYDNMIAVCQLIYIASVEYVDDVIREEEEKNPNMTGSQLTELLHDEVKRWKEYYLDYYKCPWNTIFLDENHQCCPGDSERCKWIIFPKGFTERDYEKAWEDCEAEKKNKKSDTNAKRKDVSDHTDEPDTKVVRME